MAGRGPQTFKKRQKEEQRRQRQEEKRQKRLQRKQGDETQETETNPEEASLAEDEQDLTATVSNSLSTE